MKKVLKFLKNISNGENKMVLKTKTLNFLIKRNEKMEPEIKCESALYVYKDGSTDYSIFTNSIMEDSKKKEWNFF